MSTHLKKISPAALIALKEALTHIYWKKEDLINFVKYTIQNTAIISTIDWRHIYKYQTASELVDRMVARPDIYNNDLLTLFREVMSFSDFSHLNRWDDPEQKIKTAQENKNKLLNIGRQGATREAITKVQIENFVIFYPKDMNEQLKVLESLNVIKEQSKLLQTHYQQKLNNLEELKKSILQKAFRGEL